ncbi:helix-turn-helix domain-containing protein [Streptomyces varsoviensis]|uniref:XRE family transcriptional regulator n=1 Tax=Streptomyces varsoviensis TaxID=67373 RepID=A0ABR5J749_9ACTN|nr:helix-turn-helix transcriptional regulator [Streptomyces varsoviensis]KOG89234.1 XRE family transcriptional regulator [Streptomyces varsoviensis]
MSSPSSSVQEARKVIARRLRDIRLDAELNGRELAKRCDWHPAKASRIENAKTRPSEKDIRDWCNACGADSQAADIITAAREAESLYREWRLLHRAGLRQGQVHTPLYKRTRHMKVYCSNVIPGLVQTQGYAERLLEKIAAFRDVPNDSASAAEARLERSRVLHDGRKRFALLIEEDVLYYKYGDAETMAGQHGHLLEIMSLPNVSLGIIPRTATREMWTLEGFLIFDDSRVQVETLSANLNVKIPHEVSLYLRAFEQLSTMAVHGAKARELILRAMDSQG